MKGDRTEGAQRSGGDAALIREGDAERGGGTTERLERGSAVGE
jgi:hypothetical protein